MVTGQTIRKGRPCQSGRIGENGGLGGRLVTWGEGER